MLKLELLPLLTVQRDLHALPRGPARFQAYLDVMKQGRDDIVVPLTRMNPMGKAHVNTLIDELIELDAEGVIESTLEALRQRLPALDAALSVGLVLVDDVAGGWTDRFLTDASERFQDAYNLKRNWSLVFIWTSQRWDADKIRRRTCSTVYRSLYKKRYGLPHTVAEMLQQEGLAARFAGDVVTLGSEELEYSRDIIGPHKKTTDFPTAFACLYGDEGALAAGYPALGLPVRAGFEVALSEALADPTPPEGYFELRGK